MAFSPAEIAQLTAVQYQLAFNPAVPLSNADSELYARWLVGEPAAPGALAAFENRTVAGIPVYVLVIAAAVLLLFVFRKL